MFHEIVNIARGELPGLHPEYSVHRKWFVKTVVALMILSLFVGLFGCQRIPKYTIDDIQSISLSCGHMNYLYCYSFFLSKSGDDWLFSAEYFTDQESSRVEFEDQKITSEDADELLEIVDEQELIDLAQRYKKPKAKWSVMDETTYLFFIRFTDGGSTEAEKMISGELEAFFYRLAEKYNNAA